MATYMTQFSYTTEAWAALTKKPEDRGKIFAALVEKLGGRLLNIYYCFGEYDGIVIVDFPDDTSTVAAVLAAIAPGHLKATKTTSRGCSLGLKKPSMRTLRKPLEKTSCRNRLLEP